MVRTELRYATPDAKPCGPAMDHAFSSRGFGHTYSLVPALAMPDRQPRSSISGARGCMQPGYRQHAKKAYCIDDNSVKIEIEEASLYEHSAIG